MNNSKKDISKGSQLYKMPELEQFIGHEVSGVRHIGSQWNGHRFEIDFKIIPDKTLLLQSIHTGSEPKDLSDCMRIGVGSYINWVICNEKMESKHDQ